MIYLLSRIPLNTGLLRYPDLEKRIEPGLIDRVRKIMARNGEGRK